MSFSQCDGCVGRKDRIVVLIQLLCILWSEESCGKRSTEEKNKSYRKVIHMGLQSMPRGVVLGLGDSDFKKRGPELCCGLHCLEVPYHTQR